MSQDDLGRRPRRSTVRIWLSLMLLSVYVAFVSLMTLWPDPSDLEFGSIASRVLSILHRFGVPESFGFNQIEFTSNIAMFVPLGLLLGLALPRRGWWLALFLLPGYSGFIEYTQMTSLSLRVPSAMDILANTAGGYLGLLLALILRAMVYSRDRHVIARAIWEHEQRRRDAAVPQPTVDDLLRPIAADPPTAKIPVWSDAVERGWTDPQEAKTERLTL